MLSSPFTFACFISWNVNINSSIDSSGLNIVWARISVGVGFIFKSYKFAYYFSVMFNILSMYLRTSSFLFSRVNIFYLSKCVTDPAWFELFSFLTDSLYTLSPFSHSSFFCWLVYFLQFRLDQFLIISLCYCLLRLFCILHIYMMFITTMFVADIHVRAIRKRKGKSNSKKKNTRTDEKKWT